MANRLSRTHHFLSPVQPITLHKSNMQHSQITECKMGSPIMVTPGIMITWKQLNMIGLDLSPLDTHTITVITLLSEMPTHRRTSGSQNVTAGLIETQVDMMPLPAPLVNSCHGIASEGHRRTLLVRFKGDRHRLSTPLTVQTTLTIAPYERKEQQTDLSLDLRAERLPGAELHPDKMCHRWTDRHGVVQLIFESQTLVV